MFESLGERLQSALSKIKGTGKIGIPALVFEDHSVTLGWEDYLEEHGYQVLKNAGEACSIDGKGC